MRLSIEFRVLFNISFESLCRLTEELCREISQRHKNLLECLVSVIDIQQLANFTIIRTIFLNSS